jgi:GntR family transcriptional repressor for pyruvate dehydrogenase complex
MFESVVREGRLSDKVSDQIAEAITSGKYPRGARLPSERALCEMFDVSRTVVREAIRSLLGSGMITVTSGRGVEVCYDPNATKGGPMRLSVKELGELEYGTVHEIRVPIEVQAAALAAERASEADVANLRRIVEQHEMHIAGNDLVAAGDADLEFHDEIARLASNPLLLGMYKTLAEVMKVVRTPVRHNAEVAETGLRAHRWLLECIAAGDANAARGAMERHLAEAERIWSGEAPRTA